MEQVKIRSYSINFKKCEEVRIGNNIFFMLYKRWSGKDDIGIDIIKAMMPADEDEALRICLEGIEIENILYKPYLATPSQMKKEEFGEKCEFWFVKKDICDEFIDYFENEISLGRIKDIKAQEKMCINKSLTSRLALAFSSVTPILYKQVENENGELEEVEFVPRICVVNNSNFTLRSDVIVPEVDKNYNIKLTEKIEDKSITAHDGFGLMTSECANAIKYSLNLDYDVDFAVIRLFNGFMGKGLLLKFDFCNYIQNYAEYQDKGCKLGKEYKIIDVFNDEIDLRNYDIILTTSQVKWIDYFLSYKEKERNVLLNNTKNCDLLNKLYITKVNKPHAKKMSKTNYQLLSNLCLTFEELKELGEESYNFYKSILNNNDLDSIKYILRDFSSKKYNNEDEEESKNDNLIEVDLLDNDMLENEVLDEIEDILQPSTKAEWLLNYNQDFKFKAVIDMIKNLVLKKICDMSAGKIYVDGSYKLIAGDPIKLINNILGINNDIALDKHEFFIPKCYDKDLVISRNPLASPLEILKIKTLKKPVKDLNYANYDYKDNLKLEVYAKYFGNYSNEIIIFNAVDSSLEVLSGADEDG